MNSILLEPSVFKKLSNIENECQILLTNTHDKITIPLVPLRDAVVTVRGNLSRRKGLSTSEGQAHLLHDLANIELQAMELGLRTLHEFADAPALFRDELVSVVLDEARHLRMCVDGIESLGFKWGHWPVLSNLWDATTTQDSLLDRILIVHCYLEGSGLDSGELILNKLNGLENPIVKNIVQTIAHEEIRHVKFGLDWFKKLCNESGLVASDDFGQRLLKLNKQIPTRTTHISHRARYAAGFDDKFISALRENAPR